MKTNVTLTSGRLLTTIIFLLALSIGNAWGTDFTLSSASSVTEDGITISFAKGSGSTAPTWYAAGLRLYASNTVTISCSSNITAITFNWEKQGKKDFASATASTGTYSHPSNTGTGTWSGSATSITFTLGSSGQLQLNTLSVTATSASCTATPSVGAASLNGSFTLSSVGVKCASASAGSDCSLSEYGFVWGTSNSSGHPNKDDNVVTNAGAYSANYTNTLSSTFSTGTTYYYRGYAKNNGNNYGYSTTVQSFTPYTVSYNSNGGSGSISQQVVNTGGSVTLPSSGFTKTGNEIKEWALNSASGTKYAKGATYSSITANATFYAIWQAATYTISKTLTHCSASPSIPSSYTYTGSAANLTYTITADDGYALPSSITVSGTTYSWNSGTGTLKLTGTISSNVSITITAQQLYTVTFDKGTGTCATASLQGTNAAGVTLPTPTHMCDGWSFAGWTTGSLVTTETGVAPATLYTGGSNYKPSSNITLYAVYQKGDGTFKKITSTPSSIPGKYVIANVSAQQAIKNETVSGYSYYLAAQDVTISSNAIASPNSNCVWDVTYESSKWIFKNGTYYFKNVYESTHHNLALTTTKPSGYSISFSGDIATLGSADDSGYQVIYYYYSSGSTHEFKSASSEGNLTLFKQDLTYYSNPSCCATAVTLSGGSPSNGTVVFSPAGPIATCGEDKAVTMTITPAAGYKLTGWSTSGVTPKSVSPAVATTGASSKAAQVITVTFNEDQATGTYTASATFTAMVDHYKDMLHSTSGYTGDGMSKSATYTVPSPGNASAPSDDSCEELHYKFVGWVEESYVKSDGTLDTGYTLISGGSAGTASDKTYIAIWAKEL